MKKISLFLIAALLVMAAMSCTTASYSGLQMTKEMPSYQSVGEFDVTVNVVEFLGSPGGANLGNITADAMDTVVFDAIQREIAKFSGDAAVNINIVQEATFVDMLLSGITGSIYSPVHVHITGTVVKYAE